MDFRTVLETQTYVLLDGAMGTQLDERGFPAGGQNNLVAPEAVWAIHRAYAQCGCHALITNTLTMNRITIETHNLDVDVKAVNRAGAELARQATEGHQAVLGNLSPTGQLLEPYGTYQESELGDAFREQAEALTEGGVDGFVIETMFDLREALCALRACREVASLPVMVSMAFTTADKGGRTMMGNSAGECAERLTDAGADVVGANCGDLDPTEMAAVVSLLRSATSLPVLAEPNAGKPEWVNGLTCFNMAPAPFAAGIVQCMDAGARVVGGCCGTTPRHIRAVASALEQRGAKTRSQKSEPRKSEGRRSFLISGLWPLISGL